MKIQLYVAIVCKYIKGVSYVASFFAVVGIFLSPDKFFVTQRLLYPLRSALCAGGQQFQLQKGVEISKAMVDLMSSTNGVMIANLFFFNEYFTGFNVIPMFDDVKQIL